MMAEALTKERLMTVEEYLAFEEKSKIKHEYMDGEIFAMAGVRRNHSLATSNISRHLGNQLEDSDCEVHIADFRVRVRETHFVYPDVAVACGEIDVETSGEIETLINPLVVFEVLSKSTEKRDRGEKAEDYFKIASLRDYILVSQNRMRVEHFHRESDNKWSLIIYEKPEDVLILDSINCKLTLRQIYLKVKFPNLKVVKSKKNGR
jgi:Uma2 family endonuclease